MLDNSTSRSTNCVCINEIYLITRFIFVFNHYYCSVSFFFSIFHPLMHLLSPTATSSQPQFFYSFFPILNPPSRFVNRFIRSSLDVYAPFDKSPQRIHLHKSNKSFILFKYNRIDRCGSPWINAYCSIRQWINLFLNCMLCASHFTHAKGYQR